MCCSWTTSARPRLCSSHRPSRSCASLPSLTLARRLLSASARLRNACTTTSSAWLRHTSSSRSRSAKSAGSTRASTWRARGATGFRRTWLDASEGHAGLRTNSAWAICWTSWSKSRPTLPHLTSTKPRPSGPQSVSRARFTSGLKSASSSSMICDASCRSCLPATAAPRAMHSSSPSPATRRLENPPMSEPLILRARAEAELDVVRRALTDPAELREWFAETADVELPHRFAFWGRYTPEGDAPHQRLVHVDDHSLRFVWRLDGIDTTAEISLDPESASSTIVTISQTHFDFQEALEERTSRGMLQTFWALALANLVDHVEGRPITHRCDFTSQQLHAEITISAPREAIYDALTDSDKFSAWSGFPVGIEPRVGGRFVMGGFESRIGYAAMIVELEPGRKMSVDW